MRRALSLCQRLLTAAAAVPRAPPCARPASVAGPAGRDRPSAAAPPEFPPLPFALRGFATAIPGGTRLGAFTGRVLALEDLRDNPGATRNGKRVGRGIGSGKGKTAGAGHKGQKARQGRTPRLGFEGGQTPLRRLLPKRGFTCPSSQEPHRLNVSTLAKWITDGRLDGTKVITMKDLRDAGAVGKATRPVKLLGRGGETLTTPVRLEVSAASAPARAAIAAAGGAVRTVYYNRLGMRALLKPSKFVVRTQLGGDVLALPKAARPPPRLKNKYDATGSLPPAAWPADGSMPPGRTRGAKAAVGS